MQSFTVTLLYYFDRLFRSHITRRCELNKFAIRQASQVLLKTTDGDTMNIFLSQ